MDIFLTAAGLIIGISAFLYAINALDAGKRRLRAARAGEGHPSHGRTQNYHTHTPKSTGRSSRPKSITALPDELKEMIKQRTCPMCAHILTRDEPLYASHIEIGKERKVLIYGCSYCYKGNRK